MLGVYEAMRNLRTSVGPALQAGEEQVLGGALMQKQREVTSFETPLTRSWGTDRKLDAPSQRVLSIYIAYY